MTRPTYHLVPEVVLASADQAAPYRAPSLDTEGFIHCTDGADELVATANRHFLGDPRDYLVLTIDLESVGSPWRIDDARGVYPHVFGPIERVAIVARSRMIRDPDGRFTAIGERLDP